MNYILLSRRGGELFIARSAGESSVGVLNVKYSRVLDYIGDWSPLFDLNGKLIGFVFISFSLMDDVVWVALSDYFNGISNVVIKGGAYPMIYFYIKSDLRGGEVGDNRIGVSLFKASDGELLLELSHLEQNELNEALQIPPTKFP